MVILWNRLSHKAANVKRNIGMGSTKQGLQKDSEYSNTTESITQSL